MFSPHLQARITEFDTQIAKFKEQTAPVDLLRERNSLLPVSQLPPELVIAILKPTIDTAVVLRDHAFSTYPHNSVTCRRRNLIKFTHIYSHWRDIALACPALWTFICMSNVERFNTLLDRSEDYPLYVDTWHCVSPVDYGHMFRRLAANTHRIHSLRTHPTPTKSPIEGGHDFEVPDGVGDTESRDYEGLSVAIWCRDLPSYLPALTILVLECSDPKDEVDILRRCPAIRRLLIKNCSGLKNAVESLTLPSLSYLQLHSVDWPLFFHLNLPSLRHVDIRQRIYERDVLPFFRHLERMLRSDNLQRVTDGSHVLSVEKDDDFIIRVKIEDRAGNTVVKVDIEFSIDTRYISDRGALYDFMNQLPQFTASLNIRIQTVGIGGMHYWLDGHIRCLIYSLHATTSVRTLRIQGVRRLECFLVYMNEKLSSQCNNTCLKQTSRSTCTPFPGLKTIVLLGTGTESAFEATKTWNSLVDWLGGRRKQGLGIEELTFVRIQIESLDSDIFDRLRQQVGKVMVGK